MVKVVFFGTPEFVIPVLQTLKEHFAVVCVVTTPDQPQGRKKILTPSAVKTAAIKHEIPVLTPQQWTLPAARLPARQGRQAMKQLNILEPDLFVVAAYGKVLPPEILTIPKYGAVNIHPSLLPKYRGASPIQQAILNGDKQTGISLMEMDNQLDHGPVLAVKKYTLTGNETFETLAHDLFKQAVEMLPHTIKIYVASKITPQAQDDTHATFCKEIKKEDGYVDRNNPPNQKQLDRMIRAYYPWPTAWTKVRIKNQVLRIKLYPKGIIQMEGKKPVPIHTFFTAYPEAKQQLEALFA